QGRTRGGGRRVAGLGRPAGRHVRPAPRRDRRPRALRRLDRRRPFGAARLGLPPPFGPVPAGGGLEIEDRGRRQQLPQPVDRRTDLGDLVEGLAPGVLPLHCASLLKRVNTVVSRGRCTRSAGGPNTVTDGFLTGGGPRPAATVPQAVAPARRGRSGRCRRSSTSECSRWSTPSRIPASSSGFWTGSRTPPTSGAPGPTCWTGWRCSPATPSSTSAAAPATTPGRWRRSSPPTAGWSAWTSAPR